MGTKTITIDDKAYKILSENKQVNESFSKVIHRTLGKKKGLPKELLGIIKGEGPRLRADLKKLRENSTKNFEEKQRKLRSKKW